MAHEQLVRLVNVSAHLGILVTQMILPKDAFYVDNVTSIKIAKVPKFASNSAVVYGIALMHAVNSLADQMHCVLEIIIVQLVFVAINLRAIQMISISAVNRAVVSVNQNGVTVTLNVNKVKFVLWVLMELKTVSIHVFQWHVG